MNQSKPLLPLLLFFAIGGCSADESALVQSPPNPTDCLTSAECAPGFVCENFQCRPEGTDPIEALDVQLTPPQSSPYVKSQYLKVPVLSDGLIELELPQPTEHRVIVYDDAFVPPLPIDVRISFAGSPRIIGRKVDLSTEMRVAAPRSQLVRLVPGDYDVTLIRLDDAPSLRTSFVVRPTGGETTTKEFHIDYRRRIYGEVSSSVSEGTKLGGIRVTAYSTTSGLASTATVTGIRGHYEITLPDTGDTAFRLVATPVAGLPAWGYEEIVMVPLGEDRQKNIALEPTSPNIQGTARLRFGSETPDGFLPLVGASVVFTASTSANLTTRVFRVLGSTDAEGYLRAHGTSSVRDIDVLKGFYIAKIDPPPSSQVLTSCVDIDLSLVSPGSSPDLQIRLDLRSHVLGQVRSSLGRPVTFADIELQAIGSDILPFGTRTDAGGGFEAWLDPGSYVMTIVPSGQTDVNETVPISARTVDIFGAPEEDLGVISMPSAVTVGGRVSGAIDQAIVANTRVELFQEIMGMAVKVSETTTDENGSFVAVLPR
jgi:hypothetical protein